MDADANHLANACFGMASAGAVAGIFRRGGPAGAGPVGYGLSMNVSATHFAQRRALAQALKRDGVLLARRLVKRWWRPGEGSEATTRLVAFESAPI